MSKRANDGEAAEAVASKLPRYGEFKDDLHVSAADLTEEVLNDWVIEPVKATPEMYVTGIGKYKDKYKIVLNSGGILPAEGLKRGDYGESMEVSIMDPDERAALERFNDWCRKRFLKPESFKERGLTRELMESNFEPLMSKDGTIKLRCDKKNPPVFARYRHEGKMSDADKADLGGKPWNRIVLEVKSFFTKGLKGAVSTRLVFLRADPAASAGPQEPKVSCDYDT